MPSKTTKTVKKAQRKPYKVNLEDYREEMGAVIAYLEDAQAAMENVLGGVRTTGITGTRHRLLLEAVEKLTERAYNLDADMSYAPANLKGIPRAKN